jgi:hypothetical protein
VIEISIKPGTKLAVVVDSLDRNLAQTAIKIRPEALCSLISPACHVSLQLQGLLAAH